MCRTTCSRTSIASKSSADRAARLWGANAVNGVINIITKSAKDTQGLYARRPAAVRSPQDFTGARYGGALGSDTQFRVYGKYFDRGDEVLANGDSASDCLAPRTRRVPLGFGRHDAG